MEKDVYKAGAYIRLSREDDNKYEESNSIKNQRELIKQFLDSQDDISIYDYYADDGKSGTNFDRPGFQKMIKDMNDKKIDCIIVKDLSRLGRNYIEVGRYIDYVFPSQNIRFISINDNIDSVKNPSSTDDILVPFKNLINDEYARDISKKVKKVKEIQRLNGEVTNGTAPYGYIVKNKKYVIDEEAAKIVRMIYDLCIAGESTIKIAYKLNNEKIDSPKVYLYKKKNKILDNKYYWYSNIINAILKNRVYCGDLLQGKTRRLSNKIKRSVSVPKSEWVIVENTHEAIIDRIIFERAQECIKSRIINKGVCKNKFNSLFKGYLKCYDCHKSMIKRNFSKFNENTYINYDCSTYMRISKELCKSRMIKYNDLYNLVLEQIKKDINYLIDFENNKLDKYSNNEELLNTNKEIEHFNKKLTDINKLKRDILFDLKKQLITTDDYNYYSYNYENQIKKINKKLNELKDKSFMLSQEGRMIKEFIKKFKQFQGLEELNENVLKELIDTIYIKVDKKIEIEYIDNNIFEIIRCNGEEI